MNRRYVRKPTNALWSSEFFKLLMRSNFTVLYFQFYHF
jgi:hypothetical protein